ncbi:MAG TPA: DUF2277 domain-containing protein [Streptosporangiaceae bacterium]|nr:DUF2277 domain-containing protein [Streptosporangiaceae bacterium]
MCRDIKILRAPYATNVTDEDVQAAAIQYVQTVSGFRRPAEADAEVFRRAVDRIASVTRDLLGELELVPQPRPPGRPNGASPECSPRTG